MNRVKSAVSGDLEREFASGLEREVDKDLCDMLYDKEIGQVAMSEQEPMLI